MVPSQSTSPTSVHVSCVGILFTSGSYLVVEPIDKAVSPTTTVPQRPGAARFWISARLLHAGRHWQSINQLSRIDVQPVGDLHDRLEPQAALAAFDLAELRPMNAASHRGGFLTKTKLMPTGTHPFAEDAGGFVQGRLGWVVGHHTQPHTARAKPTRAL